MSSTRYQPMFAAARLENRGVFVPFVVVGDPDIETSVEIMSCLAAAGADALELGIPFSDPVADGPTIQAAAVRALQAGATPERCLEAIAKIREMYPDLPIGILTYANTVHAPGEQHFYQALQSAGIDSVLIADLPVFEAQEHARLAEAHGVEQVFIAPPNAHSDSLRAIARMSRGYTYVVARSGVTGANEDVQLDFKGLIQDLQQLGAPPSLIGFGISKPQHVAAVIGAGADGAISGSAVVRIIERHMDDRNALLAKLEAFVSEMKGATGRQRGCP